MLIESGSNNHMGPVDPEMRYRLILAINKIIAVGETNPQTSGTGTPWDFVTTNEPQEMNNSPANIPAAAPMTPK